MTGYGAGRADAPTARVTVELRSVNQRFLDVKIVAPREYAAWEREVRDRVRAVAQRGRVEVTVARTALAARRRYAVAVRAELARAYVAAARQLGRRLGLAGDVALAAVLAGRRGGAGGLGRLEAHLGALATTLRDRGPVGKRIEFLLQEIQRELNTTGAKAGDREITDRVLGAKAEVEKLREQVQNVE